MNDAPPPYTNEYGEPISDNCFLDRHYKCTQADCACECHYEYKGEYDE